MPPIQPIAGVVPPEYAEVTITTVWPSNASTALGRFLGRLYSIRAGIGILTVGNLIAVLSIPLALGLFFYLLAPGIMRRYRLTNRRVIIERGLSARPESWVTLDDFDAIDIEVLPGQAWYPAGELIFRKGQIETFRLHGVPRPEGFRHTCLEAQRAYSSVKRIRERELAQAS
jgi:hypothetical protein